jgi:hypothetical protein
VGAAFRNGQARAKDVTGMRRIAADWHLTIDGEFQSRNGRIW